ncbi:hypothetical protein K3N28_16550 [Glycomyces sp. TRM65418]|uniref:hypothetical protein n=1 Tax=Glycomyces sp. TRM65418 TaxID=2867006 RepID=UPI001CE4EC0D|nr:hypothetical protein [Glycomyces sp. TRM65418]MCC3764669.1 hypothetical protein [Glycomyces sp. TRM65418]QZD54329.1 hypothetical protein K3N28_16465 [Glycomyces sp. TRM65418]
MNRIEIPEDYEDRLAAGRRAAARLPAGPIRDAVDGALAAAPERERYERAAALAERGAALAEALEAEAFDGTDSGRVAWLRLDCSGRLRSLALSPTIDRMSSRAVADAIEAAWTAAEAARSEHVLGLERAHAELLAARVPDWKGDELRDRVARASHERFAHVTEDDLCAAEVNLEGRLTEFKFMVPNATLGTECEALAARAAETIRAAQADAAVRLEAVLAQR